MESTNIKPPSIRKLVTTDWGSFLAVFGAPIVVLVVMVLLIIASFTEADTTITLSDLFLMALLVPLSSMIWWPMVFWWYMKIRRVYRKNKTTEGAITDIDKSFLVTIGVKYRYSDNGNEKEGILSFLNVSRVRSLLDASNITVVYDPNSKISFIKEIFD